MLKNFIKIAFRNIWKNKVFSLINILGLSIGLSASFVIGAIVFYDLTFDKFHKDGDRIYRITTEFQTPEGNFYNPGITVLLAQALKDLELNELEAVAPFLTTYPLHVENKQAETVFKNPDFVLYADADYFKTLDYNWLQGSPIGILEAPNEVVLSEERAKKYFPEQDLAQIMGKTIVYNDSIPATITGIVANFKDRTDLVFEEFISLKTADKADMTSAITYAHWNNTNSASQLFIKLSPTAKIKAVQTILDKLSKENEESELVAIGRTNNYHMQPFTAIHLDPNYNTFDFDESRANASVLISLAFVALFLLLLGCINFINLNTAQATKRAKEIGIRKTLGSSRKQLILQFLGETLLLTIGAAVLSLVLASGLLQLFSEFISPGINFELFGTTEIIVSMVVLLLLVTFLSGLYPAIVLSNYKPISVLKSQNVTDSKITLRKYLTVFQFVIAQIFIIATLLVGKQLNYVLKKDMGFKTEAIAFFRTPWSDASWEKKQRFVKEIEAIPSVSEVTIAGSPPASFNTHAMGVLYVDGDKEINTDLEILYGNPEYFKMYDLKLLAGRLPLNDTIKEYVINETYLKSLGIINPIDIIGKSIKSDNENLPIVGVMKDFNQRSLKTGINAMAFTGDNFRKDRSQFNTIHFKLPTNVVASWPSTISKIESIWKTIYPSSEFDYSFMDDTIKQFYTQEKKTTTLLNWATGLAIAISCLGLLALVIHSTERRTKEIGIRKVLGASLIELNMLLTKEFLVLVSIAFIIACPIAWYGINYWLEGFAYKTQISWWVFILSGLAMVFIALLIISFKTIIAAKRNPVKSLRTD